MPASNPQANTQTIGLKSLLAKYEDIEKKTEECTTQLNNLTKRVIDNEGKVQSILNN